MAMVCTLGIMALEWVEPGNTLKFEGLLVRCPKCGSDDVVLKQEADGYYSFYECNKCKYKKR